MRIILNADDFGYSDDTVRATIAALEQELLTSATIMARMPATAAALDFARSRPDLSFGVHLTFTGGGEERPVCAPTDVRSLVGKDGRFLPGRSARLRMLGRRLDATDVEREARAQIEAVLEAGVRVDHVDSHRHLHKFTPFREVVERVLPSYRIERIRTVQDVYLHPLPFSPTYWLGRRWRSRLARRFITTDHFYMPTTAGDRDWYEVVDRLDTLEGATIEIGLHPGRAEEWRRQELAGVARFVDAARARGHELIRWADVV